MARLIATSLFLMGLVTALSVGGSPALACDDEVSEKIRVALRSKTAVDFVETPLSDVVKFLKDKHDIEIHLDKSALEDVGIAADSPITWNLKGISLKSVLRLMLRELDLTYTVRDEVLLITTPEVAGASLCVRLYGVGDLVRIDESLPISSDNIDFQPLIALVQTMVAPPSWEEQGGPAAVIGFAPTRSLVVSQTDEVHEQIEKLLTMVRKFRQDQLDVEKKDVDAAPKAADSPLRTKVYQVMLPADERLRVITQDKASGAKDAYDATQAAVSDLVKLIASTVSPDAWNVKEGRWVRGIPGAIVVRHDAATQLRVKNMLTKIGAVPLKISTVTDGGSGAGVFRVP
jgi:hypothetical protein